MKIVGGFQSNPRWAELLKNNLFLTRTVYKLYDKCFEFEF